MSAGIKANNDGSIALQVNGTDRVTLSSAGVMEVPAGITAALTGNAATATQLSTASGSAPSYAARAWVNFNGTASGTFDGGTSTVSRTAGSTTATVTTTNDHGLITGNTVQALTGVVAGAYTVTVTGLKTFTITTVATTVLTATSITFAVNSIRASGNVSSITDNGTGDYTVNFATAMPDINYVCVGSNSYTNGAPAANTGNNIAVAFNTPTSTTSIRVVNLYSTGTAAAFDSPAMMISIFR